MQESETDVKLFLYTMLFFLRVLHRSYARLWIEETNDLLAIETEILLNLKGLVAIEIATAVRKKSLAAVATAIWFFETPPPAENESSIANR